MKGVFKTGKQDSYKVSSSIPKIGTMSVGAKIVPIKHDGKVTGAALTSTGITKRKRTEEALRRSEEQARLLLEFQSKVIDTAIVWIDLLDKEGNVTLWNRAAELISGYSRKEVIGHKKIWEWLYPDPKHSAEAFSHAKELIDRGGRSEGFESTIRCKDGTLKTISWYDNSILDENGEPVSYIAVGLDITERKTAEKSIRESQEKFERLFMGNPEASVYLDTEFHIVDVNPRFLQLFGYSIDELKGKHVNDVVVPEDMMEEARRLDENATKSCAYYDTVRKNKDGSLVHVSVSTAPIILGDKLVGYVGVYKDVSDLRKTQRQLALMNEKLEVVGGLTRHDVRNKLAAVTGNVYLAKKRLTDDPKLTEYLGEIEKAVQQTTEILHFARDYEMVGMEELTYIDVEKTVNEAAGLFTDLKAMKITNTCRGLTALADHLLRHVFYNLIDDSLRYGEKASQIRIYYEEKDEHLKLVYEDDGVGIPAKMKANLFTEGYGKGTGYGLFLIKRICEVYGWTIQETGIQGKGVQFIMTIPKKNQQGKPLYKLL